MKPNISGRILALCKPWERIINSKNHHSHQLQLTHIMVNVEVELCKIEIDSISRYHVKDRDAYLRSKIPYNSRSFTFTTFVFFHLALVVAIFYIQWIKQRTNKETNLLDIERCFIRHGSISAHATEMLVFSPVRSQSLKENVLASTFNSAEI